MLVGESIALFTELRRQLGRSFADHPEERSTNSVKRTIAELTARSVRDQPKDTPQLPGRQSRIYSGQHSAPPFFGGQVFGHCWCDYTSQTWESVGEQFVPSPPLSLRDIYHSLRSPFQDA